MANNHNTEYKESWWDEYLKSVCAFANARGAATVASYAWMDGWTTETLPEYTGPIPVVP